MDDEASSDLQCLSEEQMDTDEGPLINENSNGLSHLLTDGEFNSVDAAVDDSSTSNQAFLNAVELSTGSVGDYLDNNTEGFNTDSFDVGDNAVNFPSDSLNNVLSDGDSRLSATYKMNEVELDLAENQKTDTELTSEPDLIHNTDTVSDIAGSEDVLNQNNADLEMEQEVSGEADNSNEAEIIGEELIDQPTENDNSQPIKETLQETDDKVVTQDSMEEKEPLAKNPDAGIESEENSLNLDNLETTEQKENTENDKIAIENEISQDKENVEATPQPQTKEKKKTEIDTTEKPVSDEKMETDVQSEAVIKKKGGGAEETEVVSEDELPTVQKPSVKDAENVSDDELPGPKPADLPADTEVVSEDELPASKKDSRKRKTTETKDGYDPGSPTSESESAGKKQAVAKNGESKPVPAEKRPSVDDKPKKKTLPELDKYWKVVNDEPTDFTGWTYLLQYVDQESDVEAAREAYDAFLSHYPYCYGYWRKYADYEKRKGSKKKCLEVLERGLKAIPLSVDLWIHYLNHIKATKTDDHAFIRAQYERAIEACGLEFRSDRLWESYIKWEAENGSALHVTDIYDRLLATPTLGYTSHFDNFQEHVMSEPVAGVVSRAELVRLREEVRETAPAQPPPDLPPGEDEPLDHIASEEEAQAIKERIIASRRKIHKTTGEEVAARWTFEEGIKRPYFHVKPLERCQLKNWKAYLEWEKQHGSLKRALVLHERCLIACALYEEFWMRLIKFLEDRAASHPELVGVQREVLERACTVHHLDKPELHLHWAHFEEAQGNLSKAADILDRIEKTCPHLVQIQYRTRTGARSPYTVVRRRINLERRREDYDKCVQLYEGYIASAKSKAVSSALAVKYARFLQHVRRAPAAARRALDDAVARDPLNARLHLQRLDLALQTPDTPYEQLEELVMSYEQQEGAEAETCAAMAWRRRELADELGSAAAARAAHTHARTLHKHLRKRARAAKHDAPAHHPPPTEPAAKKKESSAPAPTATTSGATTYYQTPPAAAQQSYDQSYAQQPYQPPWGYQQPPGPYPHHPHHPHPWPQYPNYY
ncbi:pre-mRNA-processing factor 39 isoform X2 [Bicyclus anynana]|uniref:Pre-mRNA-processing factor 39 isoform X2 n=1 Tax=Bicyclus anynana TaxID=110368 RepID=A0ABM3LYQ2_BICAN|nr:pre-mRNA-processing factor 39 isoform X2 [Bicyclus anynana]